MDIAKNKDCLRGESGFYLDKSRNVTVSGVTLLGINRYKKDEVEKTNIFCGGDFNDNRSKS